MAPRRCENCFKVIETPVCHHCGYPERGGNDAHQLPVGTVLRERYRVGKLLGQGGFGITYKGWDETFEREVAIKEFFPSSLVTRQDGQSLNISLISASSDQSYRLARERFLREAQALSRVDHIPQIVRVYDFFRENNTAYIVMEYIRGTELRKYVQLKGGRLEAGETLRILKPVMEALEKVHKLGMIHRDISPDNIMLDPMGGAKLLDFGAVRSVDNPQSNQDMSHSTQAIVKHGFAPPEQYRGRGSLGPWTDVYALCATIYYCLTGQIPPDAMARAMKEENIVWNQVQGLSFLQRSALTKGMAPRATDRYQDMGALREALCGKDAQGESQKSRISIGRKKNAPTQLQIPAGAEQSSEGTQQEHSQLLQEESAPWMPRDKKKLRYAAVGAAVLVVLITAIALLAPVIRYNRAAELFREESYEAAAEIFEDLGDYSDSADRVRECRYRQARELRESGQYEAAAGIFEELGSYMDSEGFAQECRYNQAQELMDAGQYEEAAVAFEQLGSYSDSAEQAVECRNIIQYTQAEALMNQKEYAEAADLFETLGSYRDSPEQAAECRLADTYTQAERLFAAKQYYEAAGVFYSIRDYRDAWERTRQCWEHLARPETVSAGYRYTVAVLEDGSAVAAGSSAGSLCKVSDWTDIVAVTAGEYHSAGLKADGTVVYTGSSNGAVKIVSEWTDIVAISITDSDVWSSSDVHIVGLKADGTVVAAGDNGEGQCEVATWTDIVAISAGDEYTVGLKADGTVVAVGGNDFGQCNVSEWTDIVAISAGDCHTVGLKADGTVVAVGYNGYGRCNTAEWTDIVAISAGAAHTVGLKADGTVVAIGYNLDDQCETDNWTDIVAITAGYEHTGGMTASGELVVVGFHYSNRNTISGWTNIRLPDWVKD